MSKTQVGPPGQSKGQAVIVSKGVALESEAPVHRTSMETRIMGQLAY